MEPDCTFDELIALLRAGDQHAASIIFKKFAQRLIGLARTRLDQQVRRKIDPDDVVQSVFRSFFTRFADGQWNLENWESLWGMLVVMTVRKCGRQAKHFHAACRHVARETPPPGGPDSSWEAAAPDPTPAEVLELTETVQQLMAGLDERDRTILEMTLQGYAVPEISERIGRTERMVYRGLDRIRRRMEELRDRAARNG